MGKIIRCLTRDATVMAMAIDSTDIVSFAEQSHNTSAVVTAALGRTLTAASMMGVMLKGLDESISIKINGGGPIGNIVATSDGRGNVRGYAANSIVEIPLRADGKLDVGGAVGTDGFLSIAKDIGGKEPYVGNVPLVSGEIAEDITSYYATSEQTPTVCALGVLVNPDLTVKHAGGLLLHLLPFCPDEVIDKIEENVKKMDSITNMMNKNMSLEDIVSSVLDGFEFDVVDQYEPSFKCQCSKEKFLNVLKGLSEEDRKDLPNENGKIEVTCRFCNHAYTFCEKDLEK